MFKISNVLYCILSTMLLCFIVNPFQLTTNNQQQIILLQISMVRISYSYLLNNYPVITKCLTSGVIMSAGDILTQKYIEKGSAIDWRRNFSLFLTGTFFLGPSLHVWYTKGVPQIVSRLMNSSSSNFQKAFVGMLFDQLLFAPIILSGFYIFHGFVSEFSLDGAKKGVETCKARIKQTLITNWKIWPIATMINLMYVPVQYRVLFANFIGLFWNMYLSLMTYK